MLEYAVIRKAAWSQKHKVERDLPLACSRQRNPNSPGNNDCCWPLAGIPISPSRLNNAAKWQWEALPTLPRTITSFQAAGFNSIAPTMTLESDSSKNGPLLAVHEVALTLHAGSHYDVKRKRVFRAAEGSVTWNWMAYAKNNSEVRASTVSFLLGEPLKRSLLHRSEAVALPRILLDLLPWYPHSRRKRALQKSKMAQWSSRCALQLDGQSSIPALGVQTWGWDFTSVSIVRIPESTLQCQLGWHLKSLVKMGKIFICL